MTLVRSIARVGDEMLPQIAVGVELLAAGGALEWAHLVVDPHVNVQPRFLVEGFGTDGAREVVQIGIVLVVHVRFQEVARRERAPAVLA